MEKNEPKIAKNYAAYASSGTGVNLLIRRRSDQKIVFNEKVGPPPPQQIELETNTTYDVTTSPRVSSIVVSHGIATGSANQWVITTDNSPGVGLITVNP